MESKEVKELKDGIKRYEKRLYGLLQLLESGCFLENESFTVAMKLNIDSLEYSIKNLKFLLKQLNRRKSK